MAPLHLKPSPLSHLTRSILSPISKPNPHSIPSITQQTRTVATTRRHTKALRQPPSATATASSKYLSPATATIVFNPPPSTPSPYQTPSLFLPQGDPRKVLLAQSHAWNNPYSTGERELPPQVRKHPAPEGEKRYHLSEGEISEIRRLRAQDPWEWTVPKLAEKFGCSRVFIGIVAPASKERKEWGAALHQRFRDRWGGKKVKAVAERHKRRELWERDL